MRKSKVIAGIEVGTSKVVVLMGEIEEGRSLNIVGLGQCSSRGVLKSDIFDFHEASDCVHAAILAAEHQAGVRIDGVYLAMSGSHVDGFPSEASVNITSADRRVSREDVEQVSALAQGRELPENRAVIHQFRRPYRLDGRAVDQPLSLQGDRLEASYWTAHGDARKISDAIHIINGFNLHVDDVILAGLATGVVAATPEEKRNGVLVLDVGRGSTDYALYQDGRCANAGSFPLGGDHLSNDLSIGLRMRLKNAESLKRRYGSAVVEQKDRSERVWLNQDLEIGDRPIPQWSVEKICELRMREIFEVVQKKLGAAVKPERIPAGVVLCGGGASLKNIDKAAADIFGTITRLGDNSAYATGEIRESQYSTALGLLHYGLRYQAEKGQTASRPSVGIFGRLKGIFQKA